jgi:hypothetical protein
VTGLPHDNPENSCARARRALCTSIGAFPLGWRERRRRRIELVADSREGQDCDVGRSLEQLLRICCFYVNQCRARSSAWGRLYYAFGLPSAVLAAAAGATALSSALNSMALGWMTAVFALAAAIISAAAAFLRCEERRDRNVALLGGWIELGDRVQEALMKYALAEKENGQLRRSEQRTFLQGLIELNKAKCLLLSGKLRAGPERDQGFIAETAVRQGSEQSAESRNGQAAWAVSAEKSSA